MKAAKRKIDSKPETKTEAASDIGWWWKPLIALAALIIVFQVYSPALDGPYFFDDSYLPPIEDAQFAQRDISHVMRTGRPLFNLSFWLTSQIVPDAGPGQHHTVNVWLHFFNSILIFLALRKLLEMTGAAKANALLAGFGAAVFLMHPVQTESVAYISGRSEPLCLVWFLGAFVVFLHRREKGVGWGGAAAVIALFAAAVGSKEHAVVLPLLLVFTDWQFGGMDAVKRNWRLYAPLFVLGVVGASLVARTLAGADTAGFGMKDLPWYQYFFTQWRALWIYLRLFLVPLGLNADYDLPISRSVMDHGAIFGLAGLIAVAGAAIYYRKRFPLAFYGLVVFFLLIAPTSSVAPIRDALAERRLYLPFLGLLLVLCDLVRRWRAPVMTQGAAMGAAVLILAVLTHGRAGLWASPLALWEDSISKSPHNSRAHFQRALLLFQEGRCEEARKGYEAANNAGNKENRLFVDWALAHDCLNQPEKAIEKLREALKVEDTAHAHSLMGMMLAKQNRLDLAMLELEQALSKDANDDSAYTYRGNVFFLQQEYDKAEADFRRALSINTANEGARRGMAAVKQRKGAAK